MDHAVNDNTHPRGEAEGSDPATMDFPSLAARVTCDIENLLESAELVQDDLLRVTTDFEWESAVTVLDLEDEIPWSPNELLARLNGIAATAYRLARCVHPLIEVRRRHLVARADRERG